MSAVVAIPVAAFGYALGAVVFWRVVCALTGGAEYQEGNEPLAILWPAFTVAAAVFAVGWLLWKAAWHLTDAPAAVATRIAERRTLARAERVKRLREAEAILAREGLDFTP